MVLLFRRFLNGLAGILCAASLQLFTLGGLFILMGIVTDGSYAFLASGVGHWLKGNRTFLQADRYLVGSVYISLALTAAFADVRTK